MKDRKIKPGTHVFYDSPTGRLPCIVMQVRRVKGEVYVEVRFESGEALVTKPGYIIVGGEHGRV